ncbi:MAG: amidase [Gammaproteobacteria bacterium]|nr:amidase [Gammaproteobacteria bacterium]
MTAVQTGLVWQSARQLNQAIRAGTLSAAELMAAAYDQIERLNPKVNAIVNLLPRDEAVAVARARDQARARGEGGGPLWGLPLAVKDLEDAESFPTTFGFRPFAGAVAKADGEVTARMRQAGAIVIGKTNVPEFGLGSNTFNALFGATCNPYDLERTAGGSSGGAAAALATGMLAVADGSDMGGSLRNPAAFCNVVGFRPSMGRVPGHRAYGWLARLSTIGPMARNVGDAALLLSVQSGYCATDPLSRMEPGAEFGGSLDCDPRTLRVALSDDLGGLPVQPHVRERVNQAGTVFADLGAEVEQACPNLDGAMAVFQVQRAAGLAALGKQLDRQVPDWRRYAKDTAVWNIERGLSLTADELIGAEIERTQIYRDAARFFERYDVLLCPAAQVTPFPIGDEWVREINGQPMATYIDWMAVCCTITGLAAPAISVPGGFTPAGGFTPEGLPVGLQIVGAPGQDLKVLQAARLFEQATGHGKIRPPIVEKQLAPQAE